MIDRLNYVIDRLELIPRVQLSYTKDLLAKRILQEVVKIKEQYELELEQEVINSPGWNETGK